MPSAVVILAGHRLTGLPASTGEDEVIIERPAEDLNPIFPEVKEILWGFGSFVVFALLMRYFLYPRLRKGMDARYNSVRSNIEGADDAKAKALADVQAYQGELATVKAEASARVDAARQQLDAERSAKLAEVNGVIAARKEAATSEAAAARAAVGDQVEAAVSSVASRAAELTLGKAPDAAKVSAAVRGVLGVGVGA